MDKTWNLSYVLSEDIPRHLRRVLFFWLRLRVLAMSYPRIFRVILAMSYPLAKTPRLICVLT